MPLVPACACVCDTAQPLVASDVSLNQTACVMLYVQDLQKRTGGILFNITKGLRRSADALSVGGERKYTFLPSTLE